MGWKMPAWTGKPYLNRTRLVFMGDWVCSVAFDEIRAARIDDLGTPVAVLPPLP